MSSGSFQMVFPDTDSDPASVERLVFCSGKIYFELLARKEEQQEGRVALCRLEQLYPFPGDLVQAEMERFSSAKVIWCQEEPMNQGAWYSMQHRLRRVILAQNEDLYLAYAGREAYAAPAVGYASIHNEQQQQLVQDALFG